MKLVTGIMTALLFIGAGNHALASIAEPAAPAEAPSANTGVRLTSESVDAGQDSAIATQSTSNNAVSISGTTDMGTSTTPPVLITGNVYPTTTTLTDLTNLARTLSRGHGGFFFDNAESPTARVSISRVSPSATSIRVMDVQSPAEVQPSPQVQPSTTPVPLPPALLLAGSGLTGLIAIRRKIRPI